MTFSSVSIKIGERSGKKVVDDGLKYVLKELPVEKDQTGKVLN